MDAGVPIKAAVAGIAMGLVYAEGKYTTLTDILGAEDAFGDMDFKVAGTADVDHRPAARHEDRRHPRRRAGRRARAGQGGPHSRSSTDMNAAIAQPRAEVAATAPKIISITIPMDKIGEVIGPKGKVINTIQQETGADIAVDDDGVRRHRHHRCRRGVEDGRGQGRASWPSSTRRRPTSARSTTAGSSTSPSSVRSSTSSRAATAWSTSPSWAGASGSTPSRTCSTLGQEIEVTRRGDRREGQGQPDPGRRRGRGRRRRRSATRLPHRSATTSAPRRASHVGRRRPAVDVSASTMRSTPSWPASSATSAPAARPVAAPADRGGERRSWPASRRSRRRRSRGPRRHR